MTSLSALSPPKGERQTSASRCRAVVRPDAFFECSLRRSPRADSSRSARGSGSAQPGYSMECHLMHRSRASRSIRRPRPCRRRFSTTIAVEWSAPTFATGLPSTTTPPSISSSPTSACSSSNNGRPRSVTSLPAASSVADDLLPQPKWVETHAGRVEQFRAEIYDEPALASVLIDWGSGLSVSSRR